MEENSKVLNLLQAARLLMSPEFGITNSPQTAIRIVQELDNSRDIGMILNDAGVKLESSDDDSHLFTLKDCRKEDMKYYGHEASIYRYGFNHALSIVRSHIKTSRKDSINSMKLLSFFNELENSVLENDIEESIKVEGIKLDERTDANVKSADIVESGKGRAAKILDTVLAMYNGHDDFRNDAFSFHYLVVLASELEDGKSGDEALCEASKFVQEFKGKPEKKKEMTEAKTE